MGPMAPDLPESTLAERSSAPRQKLVVLGARALLCYVIHSGYHVLFGIPADALWTCNIGTLLVALGALFCRPMPIAIGVSWIAFGNPLWLLDIATGAAFLPTSLLTHVGGLLLGVFAIRELGWPKGVWWRAVLGNWALILLTHFVTPATDNVNLAFRVQDGWEHIFPGYLVYMAFLSAVGALVFLLVDWIARRLGS